MLIDDMIIKMPLDSRVHGGVGRAPPPPDSPLHHRGIGRVVSWSGVQGATCGSVTGAEGDTFPLGTVLGRRGKGSLPQALGWSTAGVPPAYMPGPKRGRPPGG